MAQNGALKEVFVALVVTVKGRSVEGSIRRTWGTLAFDASYPTNGEAYINANFELFSVEQINVYPSLGYIFEPDLANKKIKAFYGDYSEASDGALVEVTNTGDLSSITAARWEAIGV